MAQLEDMDIPEFSVYDNLRRVLLPRGGYAMEIDCEDLEVTFVHEKMIPKRKELAGSGGAVHCLSDEVVGQRLVADMQYKNFKEGKAIVVGDSRTSAILTRALSFQGGLSSNGATKRQKRIGQQAVDVFQRSQVVAAHQLKELKDTSDSEDEETATAA